MPRGYWCILITIAGLATGYPVGQDASAQTSPAQNRGEARQQPTPAATNTVEDSLARIARAAEASQANPATQREEQRSQADLSAQQDMAKWTMWMFFAAIATTVLTALGVFLIWRTLLHTRKATKATERMAFDTSVAVQAAVEANNEMRRANEIAHQTMRQQLRAYLDFDGIDWITDPSRDTDDNVFVGVRYSFKNFGQTPAREVVGKVTYEAGAPDAPARFVGTAEEQIGMISPADHVRKHGWFHMPRWLWQALAERKAVFYATIEATYADDFGNTHTMGSKFMSEGTKSLGFVVGSRFAD